MMRFIAFLFIAVLTFNPVFAQDREVTLDVFSDQSAIVKGGQFNIAIRQNIRDGWHTYWHNPGDSGEAMSVTWNTPNGVVISKLQYPVPDKTIYGADLTSYTLHGAPILTATVSVPENLEGHSLTINGSAHWLACEEICVPEEQEISLTLPIAKRPLMAKRDVFDMAIAAQPRPVDWHATISQDNANTVFTVSVPPVYLHQMTDVTIMPFDYGVVNNSAPTIADLDENGVVRFEQLKGDNDLSDMAVAPFLLKTDQGSFVIQAKAETTRVSEFLDVSLLFILGLAFLGGLVLNLMPCVFPVLSMKALSLVKLSDYERHHARLSGLSYAAGIIISFLLVAGLLVVLKNGGAAIGWGFQLQSPIVISILLAVIVAVGLNLWGVFEISGGRLTSWGSAFTSGNSNRASFWTGVLAMLVATPCTAPFMATAIGYALTQTPFVALSVFATLGFGLAFPYVLFCFVPAAQAILPKPGAWMNTFRKFLAVPMFITAFWLVWVLVQQLGFLNNQITSDEPFTNARLEQTLRDNPNKPVFTDMTAAWCITCLMNKKTSLTSDAVQDAFIGNGVIYMVGDWTNKNAEITQYLESFNRNGVPLYVYYGATQNGKRPAPIVLPQILTPAIVLKTINGK